MEEKLRCLLPVFTHLGTVYLLPMREHVHTYTFVHLHTTLFPCFVQEHKKKEEARRVVQEEELRRARKEEVRRVRQQYREDFAVEEVCDFVRTLSAGGGARPLRQGLSLNTLVATMRDAGTAEKERRSG